MATHTCTHVKIGFANPYLICGVCKAKVPYWHDPDRCSCDGTATNEPCGHDVDTISTCYSWSPVDGCTCKESHK